MGFPTAAPWASGADEHGVAKPGQGLVLDLANPLARQADALADLFQRQRVVASSP